MMEEDICSEGSVGSSSYIWIVPRLLLPLVIESQDHVVEIVVDPIIRKIFRLQVPFNFVDKSDNPSSVREEELLEAAELFEHGSLLLLLEVLVEVRFHAAESHFVVSTLILIRLGISSVFFKNLIKSHKYR